MAYVGFSESLLNDSVGDDACAIFEPPRRRCQGQTPAGRNCTTWLRRSNRGELCSLCLGRKMRVEIRLAELEALCLGGG